MRFTMITKRLCEYFDGLIRIRSESIAPPECWELTYCVSLGFHAQVRGIRKSIFNYVKGEWIEPNVQKKIYDVINPAMGLTFTIADCAQRLVDSLR